MKITQELTKGIDFPPIFALDVEAFKSQIEAVTRRRLELRDQDIVEIIIHN